MMSVKERVAYLHGLTKGLNVDETTSEGKAILGIIDVLEDMADEVQSMYDDQQELETYVEALDEDLNDLEEDFYEDFTECCNADFVEMQCPSCHEDVSFESEFLDADKNVEISCPHCGHIVYGNVEDEHEVLRDRYHG